MIKTLDKNLERIKSVLDLSGLTLKTFGINLNIQIYFLTVHDNKKALTKNKDFRSSNDTNLPEAEKIYHYLEGDFASGAQVALAITEDVQKYLCGAETITSRGQRFVLATPIKSSEGEALGVLCFSSAECPVYHDKIKLDEIRAIGNSMSKTISLVLDSYTAEQLTNISE